MKAVSLFFILFIYFLSIIYCQLGATFADIAADLSDAAVEAKLYIRAQQSLQIYTPIHPCFQCLLLAFTMCPSLAVQARWRSCTFSSFEYITYYLRCMLCLIKWCVIILKLFSCSLNARRHIKAGRVLQAPFAAARQVWISVPQDSVSTDNVRFLLQRWSKKAPVLIASGSGLIADVARIVQRKHIF